MPWKTKPVHGLLSTRTKPALPVLSILSNQINLDYSYDKKSVNMTIREWKYILWLSVILHGLIDNVLGEEDGSTPGYVTTEGNTSIRSTAIPLKDRTSTFQVSTPVDKGSTVSYSPNVSMTTPDSTDVIKPVLNSSELSGITKPVSTLTYPSTSTQEMSAGTTTKEYTGESHNLDSTQVSTLSSVDISTQSSELHNYTWMSPRTDVTSDVSFNDSASSSEDRDTTSGVPISSSEPMSSTESPLSTVSDSSSQPPIETTVTDTSFFTTNDTTLSKVVNACASDPCKEGFCRNHGGAYDCLCYPGWKGVNCSEDVDECSENSHACDPLLGQCNNTDGSYNCSCRDGAKGDGFQCTEIILYPYSDNNSCDESYFVPGGLSYFGEKISRIYVSNNGYLSLNQMYDRIRPVDSMTFPEDVAVIAPYWADIDVITDPGRYVLCDVSNIETDNDLSSTVRDHVTQQVLEHAGIDNFIASFILVVTWRDVSPYPAELYSGLETATFQVVLATDSKQSFVLYNYDRGRMLWNSKSDNRTILLGHSDGRDNTQLVDASSIYKPDMTSNIGKPGRYFYKLGDAIDNSDLGCIEWATEEREVVREYLGQSEPCPCTLQQALRDTRFQREAQQDLFVSVFPRGLTKQVCSYDSMGALETGPTLTGQESSHIWFESLDDKTNFDSCCKNTSLCHMFYEARPSDDCSRYQTPTWGLAWGDPHFLTLDEVSYTFNGKGEYILLQLGDNDFQLHGRTEQALNLSGSPVDGTVFTACAAQGFNTSRLEVRLTPDKNDVHLHVDGSDVGTLADMKEQTKLFNKLVIRNIQNENLSAQFESGVAIQVGVSNSLMKILVSVPADDITESSGLLATDSFRFRNGELLESTADDLNQLYIFDFGKNWTVTKNESLFNYVLDGAQYENFSFPDFTPIFYADLVKNFSANFPSLNETEAHESCANNTACLEDYAATGNALLAMATRTQQERFTEDKMILENKAPVFKSSTPAKLLLTVNIEVILDVSAVDPDGDNVNITVDTDVTNYTFESSIFRWTPSEYYRIVPTYLRFFAVDMYGAAAVYWPDLHFCGCAESSANCSITNYSLPDSANKRFYWESCTCLPGYKGRFCTDAKDVCKPNPCYPDVKCTSKSSYPGYECDSCPKGMTGDGVHCYSNNECVMGTAGCTHLCTNLRQGFRCDCKPGYRLESDNATCTDIDECTEELDNCTGLNQYCVNSQGGFSCSCKTRYFQNGSDCIPAGRKFGGSVGFKGFSDLSGFKVWEPTMNEPSSDNFKVVSLEVENILNAVYSDKYTASFVASDVYQIEEGSIRALFNVYFTQTAPVNVSMLSDDLQNFLLDRGCSVNGADCTIGSLVAIELINSTVIAKDLCTDENDNNCDDMSTTCTSLGDGTFKCNCREGYRKFRDSVNICQDIDECAEMLDDCDNATSACENLPGNYRCVCEPGYSSDQGACIDVCKSIPCQNDGTCSTNLQNGGFSCKCSEYWEGPTCGTEDEDYIRMRNIAIGVGVGIGLLCLILIIIFICACVRVWQKKHSGYTFAGESSDSMERWGNVSQKINTQPATYEMTENGSSQDNLYHQRPARYQDPAVTTNFDNRRSRGLDNPAYMGHSTGSLAQQ